MNPAENMNFKPRGIEYVAQTRTLHFFVILLDLRATCRMTVYDKFETEALGNNLSPRRRPHSACATIAMRSKTLRCVAQPLQPQQLRASDATSAAARCAYTSQTNEQTFVEDPTLNKTTSINFRPTCRGHN
jgi:hypothetical protein